LAGDQLGGGEIGHTVGVAHAASLGLNETDAAYHAPG
jgi:hypothetical protein